MIARTVLFLTILTFVSCASKKNEPNNRKAEIHYNYGTEELFNKNYTQAISHLLKAAELDPKNPDVHNNLAMAYYFKEQKDMTMKHVKLALQLNPKHTDALVNLASLYFEQGDLAQAEKLYNESLLDLTFEKHARTHYNLALIALKRNNEPMARHQLNLSLKQSEDYCPSWLQLGKLELKARRLKEATKHFHQARMGPCVNYPAPLYWQAAVLVEMGEFLNARIKLDELITRFANTEFYNLAQQKLTEITLLENGERRRGTLLQTHDSQNENHNF
jgi:Tfp pilus assembly protein PilF